MHPLSMLANASSRLTNLEDDVEELLADAAAKDAASVGEAVHLGVVDFEGADHESAVWTCEQAKLFVAFGPWARGWRSDLTTK